MALKGIDVSYWNGNNIDWNKVKADGVKFAILRCGYSTTGKDSTFERNVKECERVGIPWGAYLFSYAESVDEAKKELQNCLASLKGKKPTYPIYYDLEDAATTGRCSNSLILSMAKVFVEGIEKAGYWAGIYANLSWFNTRLTDSWYDKKAKWVAQYNDKCTYKKTYGMWQYTSGGKVKGIDGRVDMNWSYVDYHSKITGKNNGSAVRPKPTKPTQPIETIKSQNIGGNDMTRGYFQKDDANEGVYAYKQLLIALKKAGIIKQGVDDNNIYGDGTVEATKQVQRAAKITIDGLAGSKTIRACYVLLARKI